jgi:hypothetical protein
LPNISLRGLDPSTLSRIKSRARRRGVSVNRLIVETLQREYAGSDQAFDDLDALAGAWSKAEAAGFAAAVAPFAKIDAAVWAAEPKTAYRVKRAARRKTGK